MSVGFGTLCLHAPPAAIAGTDSRHKVNAFRLLLIPGVSATIFGIFQIFAHVAAIEPIIELYFGRAPFYLSTKDVGLVMGLVSLCLVFAAAISGLLVSWAGPIRTLCWSTFLLVWGSLFFGPSPMFGDTFNSHALNINIIGMCCFGLGSGTFLPLASSLLLQASGFRGYDKDEVSEALGALLTSANQIGFIIGPLFGPPVFEAIGLPMMESLFAIASLMIPFYIIPCFVGCSVRKCGEILCCLDRRDGSAETGGVAGDR